ncbi:MAG: ABC transporter permease subunit, partial [Desulforhopalus sp.]
MSIQDILLQQLANGLILGSFYALVALGYTMVYGIIKLLNFAHGDLYMIGSFVGFVILSFLSAFIGSSWAGILCSMVLSMIAVGLLGVLIQRIAYVPMLSAP